MISIAEDFSIYIYSFVNLELETVMHAKAVSFAGKWYLRSYLTCLKRKTKIAHTQPLTF